MRDLPPQRPIHGMHDLRPDQITVDDLVSCDRGGRAPLPPAQHRPARWRIALPSTSTKPKKLRSGAYTARRSFKGTASLDPRPIVQPFRLPRSGIKGRFEEYPTR